MHDFWVIDLGATNHMTNKMIDLYHFKKFSTLTHVFFANEKKVFLLRVKERLDYYLKI